MRYTITAPQRLDAAVKLPASKSISNRALIIYALTEDSVFPENLSVCDDTEVIVNALRDRPETIDIRAAGTAMRFMTAYLAVTDGTHILTGTERMKQRPVKILVDTLRYLGADIEYLEKEGFPPLKITGRKLEGGSVEMAGNVSSQYISALLMIAPKLTRGLELKLTDGITSRPYIDLTLCLMRDFGASADWTGADTIKTEPKPYEARPFIVESDWSAASYWYEILALCDETDTDIRLTGLVDGSRQGDTAVRYLFSLLGVKTKFEADKQGVPATAVLRKLSRPLPRLEYNFINQPDVAQTFIVTCCMADIPFRFKGLKTLKIKETDRINAMKTEMRKLGYVVRSEDDDELYWDGERCEADPHPVIETYEDHRMAMSFAPVSLVRPNITINHPEVVSKSYPSFWNDLRAAGFQIEETP